MRHQADRFIHMVIFGLKGYNNLGDGNTSSGEGGGLSFS